MSLVAQRYVRKPFVVDAIQVTEDNFKELAAWCQGSIRNNSGAPYDGVVNPRDQHIHVRVHNPRSGRQTQAFLGDWILYTDLGGYKVYNTKAFLGSFDPMGK